MYGGDIIHILFEPALISLVSFNFCDDINICCHHFLEESKDGVDYEMMKSCAVSVKHQYVNINQTGKHFFPPLPQFNPLPRKSSL